MRCLRPAPRVNACRKLVACSYHKGVVMHKRVVVVLLAVAISTALVIRLAGQAADPGRQLASRAADALGGRDRVMSLKSLEIVGYGELAYFNGGGNITGALDAPQKWQKVLEFTRTIDLEHWRTRVQQRLKMDFVFASTAGQLGLNRTNESLDGDVAYNVGGGFLAAPQSGPPQPQPASAAWSCWRTPSPSYARHSISPASCRTFARRGTCNSWTSPSVRATR